MTALAIACLWFAVSARVVFKLVGNDDMDNSIEILAATTVCAGSFVAVIWIAAHI